MFLRGEPRLEKRPQDGWVGTTKRPGLLSEGSYVPPVLGTGCRLTRTIPGGPAVEKRWGMLRVSCGRGWPSWVASSPGYLARLVMRTSGRRKEKGLPKPVVGRQVISMEKLVEPRG